MTIRKFAQLDVLGTWRMPALSRYPDAMSAKIYHGQKCYGPQCDRPAQCKDMCLGHYQQAAAGKPLSVIVPRKPKDQGKIAAWRILQQELGSETHKVCIDCLKLLPKEEFYYRDDSFDGLRNDCASCSISRMRDTPSKLARQASSREREVIQDLVDYSRSRADWYQKNKERLRPFHAEAERRRRVRKRSGDVRIIQPRDIDHLICLYRGICAYCKSAPWDALDHVIPVVRGGRQSIGNLLPVCTSCNQSKHDKTVMEWRIWRLRHAA